MDPSNPSELATHYQVLKLSPAILDTQHDPSTLIKKAYHRALLQNHPDKATPSTSSTSSSSSSSPSIYTVDQITRAFTVLSSPSQRAAYDTSLRLQTTSDGEGIPGSLSTKFQTGVENVDLDDLAFDDAEECWYRSCRCGNDRGYLFHEADLEEVGDEGELMVGCLDCSLWLRVHFAVVEDDQDIVDSGQRN